MDQSNINFAVYEDGQEYYGMASVTMPTLANLVQSINGAGIAGNIEAVILGHVDNMTLGLNFRTTTPASIRLSEPRRHQIDLRVAQQQEDPVNNSIDAVAEKHVFVVIPKNHNVGSIAPASPSNGTGEYAVRYWATWINGKKVREIDPMNFICEIDGVDYLAPVRKALGK
jgi:P2 family phage contractile tail tube protein